MRLAISNIAWDIEEDDSIAPLLTRLGIDAIDVAPTKYFPDLYAVSDNKIDHVRRYWADHGVEITGMQSLFFGSNLNMFGSTESRVAMLRRLSVVCRIGARLGASRLVFGSFKNRDRAQLSDEETISIALNFFRNLGEIAQSYGVLICLEPIPDSYGANFMCTSATAADMVVTVDHPAIRMQLDTGTMAVNAEDTAETILEYAPLIAHIHASEPDLGLFGFGGADHAKVGRTLRQRLPEQIVSVEMLATKNEPHVLSVERALIEAVRYYRDDSSTD